MLRTLPDNYVDSVVTDPPYGLSKEPDIREVLTKWLAGEPYDHGHGGFMGKAWDSFVPHPDVWREVYRVLKPGAYALVFAGTRTQDLMTIALRIAGFEVRDVIEWLYFSGFPKSMDVGKAFDKREGYKQENRFTIEGSFADGNFESGGAGWTKQRCNDCGKLRGSQAGNCQCPDSFVPQTPLARQWDGWGTALKPAHEPIIVVRKPLIGTVADNVERYGTGAVNIDGCRIDRAEGDRTEYGVSGDEPSEVTAGIYGKYAERLAYVPDGGGRFPANCVTTDADAFYSPYFNVSPPEVSKKASKRDRNTTADGRVLDGINVHPTVKTLDLMAWLIRLLTPPGGTVLDPFAGSGSTLVAAKREGFNYVGIEREPEYVEIARTRTLDPAL